MDQQRDDDRVRVPRRHRPPRVRARHPGHLSGSRVGNQGRARADAPPRPRDDRPGRLGAGLPGDPAPGSVLRRQARDEGHVRVAAVRVAPPGLGRERDDGPAARDEHAAVRPLPEQDATPPDAGAADLRARGRGAGDLLGRAPSPARAVRRPSDGLHDHRQQARAVVGRALPGEDRGGRPADRRAIRRRGGGEPVRAGRRRPRRGVARQSSTTSRTREASRPGSAGTGSARSWPLLR